MLRSVLIFTSVAFGAAIGYTTGLYSVGALLAATGLLIWLYITLRLRKNFSDYVKLTRLHLVWPCLLLSGTAALSGVWNRPSPEHLPLKKELGIIAEVTERTTTTRGEKYGILIETVSLPGGEKLECRNVKGILWASAETLLEPGDIVSYRSVLTLPDSVDTDEKTYFTYDRIRVYENRINDSGNEVFHYRNGDLKVIDRRKGPMEIAWKYREDITVLLENSGLSQESAQLMRALLTGKRSGMSKQRLEDFKDAGVAHTLAVSGMHVGILGWMVLCLTLPFNLIGGRNWRYVLTLLSIWAFAILTGMQVSILRATLMMTLVVVAAISDRRRDAFRALCIAGVIILVIWPQSLWDIGFQLSFICVAALCLLGEELNPIDRRNHPRIHDITGILTATLVATGSTWAVSAYYFGAMPLHFVLANLVLLPVLPVLMGAGIVYLLILAIGAEIGWLAMGINFMVDWLYKFIGTFKGTSLSINPSIWTVWIWLTGVVALSVGIHRFRPEARMRTGALPLTHRTTAEGEPIIWWPGIYLGALLFLAAIIIEIIRTPGP